MVRKHLITSLFLTMAVAALSPRSFADATVDAETIAATAEGRLRGQFHQPRTELWSFQPVVKPSLPGVNLSTAVRNALDNFILARLEQAGLAPSPRAERATLVRRLYLTLHGLPPTPAAMTFALNDAREDWYERLVDELLASPRYGERWAQHWLDLVRYADSNGFETNRPRPTAYHYRDYVIAAFNEDKPYDRFVLEQIAGDAIGADEATGFLVSGPHDIVAGQNPDLAPMQRSDGLADIVNATTTSLLALTVACARCHDHKFDAISQHDYYATEAIFAGLQHGERPLRPEELARHKSLAEEQAAHFAAIERRLFTAAQACASPNAPNRYEPAVLLAQLIRLHRERAATNEKLASWPVTYAGTFGEPPPTHLLNRGDPLSPGEAVSPGCLSEFGKLDLAADEPEQRRRMAFAQWVSHPDNPLTARVMVNRIWQQHFGRGIVATPSDFGENGVRPTHPELLDYLASELASSGWSIKHIQRLIVHSATYQQASAPNEAARLADAENKLLWRFAPRRIEAEAIRDRILAASGKLDLTMGGPGFPLFDAEPGNVYNYVAKTNYGPAEWRRMIYAQRIRGEQEQTVGVFDCPDGGQVSPRRERSTTPLQALNLLNSPFISQHAGYLADRAATEVGSDPAAQVDRIFELALQRLPKPAERAWASELVKEHGLPALGRALFNANEFLFVF